MKKNLWFVICMSAVALSVTGCQKESNNISAAPADSTEIPEGGSLSVSLSDLSEQASFYPITVDGTPMEIIAGNASDGSIRTAFNTCQICYDSGRGYYKQDGTTLICQNCGNSFTMDQVGTEAGGCNPWPILDTDRTISEDSIQIPYTFLAESKNVFAKWKK